jgi:hypothetical protein
MTSSPEHLDRLYSSIACLGIFCPVCDRIFSLILFDAILALIEINDGLKHAAAIGSFLSL